MKNVNLITSGRLMTYLIDSKVKVNSSKENGILWGYLPGVSVRTTNGVNDCLKFKCLKK